MKLKKLQRPNEVANECGFKDFDALLDYLTRFEGKAESIKNAKLREVYIRLIEKNYWQRLLDEHSSGKQDNADKPH